MAAMLRDSVAVAVAVCRAYAPRSNTTSRDYHERINSWVSYECGAPLGGSSGRRSSAIILLIPGRTANLFNKNLRSFLVVRFRRSV